MANDELVQPVAVEPRDGHRIWVRYSDGPEGEIDLSHLAGHGVFTAWDDRIYFEKVHVTEHRSIAWDDQIELCPDALYMELTGLTVEELMPAARSVPTDARRGDPISRIAPLD